MDANDVTLRHPPYSGQLAVCVKCGATTLAGVRYMPLSPNYPERLVRTCDVCGYKWPEAVLDAEPGATRRLQTDPTDLREDI